MDDDDHRDAHDGSGEHSIREEHLRQDPDLPLHERLLPSAGSSSSSSIFQRDHPPGDRGETGSTPRWKDGRDKRTNPAWALLLLGGTVLWVLAAVRLRPEPRVPERHPLGFPRRKLEESAVRYLSLGGPSTWGAGLEHPEPIVGPSGGISAFDAAYPYKLSPDAHNGAQRVGGPSLAALCTETVVDDSSNDNRCYDVVTLEFSGAESPDDLAALRLLAERLRKRFPNALLVLVRLWTPADFHDRATNTSFADWRRERRAAGEAWEDPAAWKSALGEIDWEGAASVGDTMAALENIRDAVGGKIVHLAAPSDAGLALGTAPTWFVERDHNDDREKDGSLDYVLSAKGHRVVANHIRSLVDQAHILDLPLEHRNALGDWGSGDLCRIWYDDGDKAPEEHHSAPLKAFGPADHPRFALEIPTRGGSFRFANPFGEDRMLYLTYMTTSVASHPNKIYPKAKVTITTTIPQEQEEEDHHRRHRSHSSGGVVVDPYHDDHSEDRHATRTTAIGLVPAGGVADVLIHPLEEATLAPFRVVGASLLSTEKASRGIRADLAPEPVGLGELGKDLW